MSKLTVLGSFLENQKLSKSFDLCKSPLLIGLEKYGVKNMTVYLLPLIPSSMVNTPSVL